MPEPIIPEPVKVDSHKALPPLAERLLIRVLNKLGANPWWTGFVVLLLGTAFDYWTANSISRFVGIKAAPAAATFSVEDGAAVRFEGKLFVVDPAKPPDPKLPDLKDPKRTPIIAGSGLRVMIVYESSKMHLLTKEQTAALWSADVVAYLNSKAPSRWKKYDQDSNLAKELPGWQEVLKRPRASLPWIVLSNDAVDFEGPYPGTVADVLAMLEKYAPTGPVVPPVVVKPDAPLPSAPAACENCGGTGQVRRLFRTVTCPVCSGMGVKP